MPRPAPDRDAPRAALAPRIGRALAECAEALAELRRAWRGTVPPHREPIDLEPRATASGRGRAPP